MERDVPGAMPGPPERERFGRVRRRMSRLSRISIFLARLPAFGYGIAFLSLIPIYALIYFFIIPDDFYHSTVTLEQAYFEQVASLDHRLYTVLLDDLRTAYGSDVIDIGDGEVICLERLQTANLSIGDLGAATFKFIIPVSDAAAVVDGECPGSSVTSVIVLDAASDLGQDFPMFEDPEMIERDTPAWLTVRMVSTESHLAATRIFPPTFTGTTVQVSDDGISYMFALPPDVAHQVVDVLRASQGLPSGIPGEFARLLYLSAITTTTTGYGDIVPITTRARLLTASESILGIILIGLFLNSITQHRSRANHADA